MLARQPVAAAEQLLPVAAAGHRARSDEHQHRPRRGTSAQVGDEAADILFGACIDERALGVTGGEYAATV